MSEDKYYIPKIEEFHIGFEYEHEDMMRGDDNPEDPNGKYWVKDSITHVKIDDWKEGYDYNSMECVWNLDQVFVRNTFRVKYLDKQDIESLGWYHDKNASEENDIQYILDFTYEKQYILHDTLSDNIITIEYIENCGGMGNIFVGKIKNKSELKKVMEMLNIGGKK